MVFAEFHGLLQNQLIGVHLGVKAVEELKSDGQVARLYVNRAPRGNRFRCVDFWFDILQVPLAKPLDGLALLLVRSISTLEAVSLDLPLSSPKEAHLLRYPG